MASAKSAFLPGAIRLAAVLLLCQLLQSSCAAQRQSPPTEDGNTDLQATSWPQADRLFRSDPRWLGGDAAFSVDLGSGRVLWLFGDSFVATHAGATRRQSTFIRNSVAIQTGYDPSQATFDSYARNRHGQPVEFAPSNDSTWLWPLDGIKLGNRLLLFYMRMASDPDKNSLGFQSVGRSAFMVDNPDAEPSRWKPRLLEGPETQSKMLIGMSIIHERGFVYAFVLNDVSHDAYLLRWPSDEAVAGNLSSPQWWCGEENGWRTSSANRRVVIHNAGSEFSVQRDPCGGFLEVNSVGFGATTIVFRHAVRLEGVWSKPQRLYRPPESDEPHAFVYDGKGHSELAGADLVITYTANGTDERLATDISIYFPPFVRVTFNTRQKNP